MRLRKRLPNPSEIYTSGIAELFAGRSQAARVEQILRTIRDPHTDHKNTSQAVDEPRRAVAQARPLLHLRRRRPYLRLLLVLRPQVAQVEPREHDHEHAHDQHRHRRGVVARRGGERAEEPGGEDAAGVGHDEADGDGGGAAGVGEDVVRAPGGDGGRDGVGAGDGEEEGAVLDALVGGGWGGVRWGWV